MLIDSRATESFISPDLVEHYQIPTCTILKPQTIRNVDGTKNKQGKVKLATNIDIHYNGVKMMHMFYVINLGLDHMLLGMPFLAATNPNIDWTKGMFRGKVIALSMDAHKWIPNQDSRVYNLFRAIKTYHHFEWPEEGELHMLNITPEDYDSQIDPTTSTFIWQITKSTELAAQRADKTECPWQLLVPAEYHQFGKVFSKEELHQFPKSRQWDHAIDLVQDAPKTLDCKMYPLAEGQQRNLDKFLDEHLEKGYIHVSNSPYTLPFFFIKKKNGKPQPV